MKTLDRLGRNAVALGIPQGRAHGCLTNWAGSKGPVFYAFETCKQVLAIMRNPPNPTGKGGFVKGQSGNPSGRPKEPGWVKELARQHTPRAIERLVEWMESNHPSASPAAANALLDRAWGRPAQAITGPDDSPLIPSRPDLRGLSDDDVAAVASIIAKVAGVPDDAGGEGASMAGADAPEA